MLKEIREGDSYLTVDMWYGNEMKDVLCTSVVFDDTTCQYRGNFYDKLCKTIGDYVSNDSVLMQRHLPVKFE